MLKSEDALDNNSILTVKILLLTICFFLTWIIVYSFFNYKINNTKNIYLNGITAEERFRHLECLAINIYREAGHEPFEGKVAVAQVTINRSNDSRFPQDICQVVYQKNIFTHKTVCQFSWYCDVAHRSRPINKTAYGESYEVAKKVLLEDFRLESLHNALYYHADYVNPKWNKERITQIGRHIFYKEKNI